MADKNIVIDEELDEEVLDEEMETPNPEQETPAVDQKPKGGFINGCKKVGRIAEAGDHETLLQTSQIYREVYESQKKGSDEDE